MLKHLSSHIVYFPLLSCATNVPSKAAVSVHTDQETSAHKKTGSAHKCFFQKCFCTNFLHFICRL